MAVSLSPLTGVPGVSNFGGYFGGSFAPAITGLVVQQTHSFVLALVLGAGIAAVSAILYLVLVRHPIPGEEL